MKHIEIKDLLKKELLVLELPRVCDYKLTKEMIFIMDKERSTIHRFKASYTLLGKPAEIKEEDAMELVEETEMGVKLNSKKYKYRAYDSQLGYATATQSLLSAIESVIFWENPYSGVLALEFPSAFEKAELRTFDRNRTLIFVKN